jgi:hypothetical protein
MQTDRQQNDEDIVAELKGWVRSLQVTQGDRSWQYFAKPLSAAMTSARYVIFDRAGFTFEYSDSPNYGKIWIGNDDLVMVEFSPVNTQTPAHAAHIALAYHRNNWRGGGLWIDGHAIDVPCDENGFPLSDYSGHWIDDDTFQVQVGLPDHPLTNPRARDQLSELRGLFFVDARTYRTLLVLPHDDERWELPGSRRDGQQILIYANRDEMADNHVVRTVEF